MSITFASDSHDAIQRDRIREKARGWEWVTAEFQRILTLAAAERDRLLGPDRGE